MLVYDVTHEKSFDNIRNWIRNIEEVSGTLMLCVMQICLHALTGGVWVSKIIRPKC